MDVPRLTAQEQLHEPHAALDQAARDQAARAVFARCRVVEAVELVRGRRFARDVERLGGGRLHGGGQFVAGDPRFEIGLARMFVQMPTIEILAGTPGSAPALRRADRAALRDSESAAPAAAAPSLETTAA